MAVTLVPTFAAPISTTPSRPAFTLPPDARMVIPITKVSGGVTRTRTLHTDEHLGEARRTEATTVQVIADEAEHARAGEISNRAKGVVSRLLQYTEGGYITDGETLAKLDRELAPLHSEAADHNRAARHHFVEIKILRFKLDKDVGENEIRAVAGRIVDELTALRDLLRAGDAKGVANVLKRSPNLPGLAYGAIRVQVQLAVAQVEDGLSALRERAREINAATKKGQTPPPPIDPATLDVGSIETAIELCS